MAAIGELVLDVTIAPQGELIPDDERDARIRIGGGGQAANFCAWAASLGEPARLITRVGDDETGRRLVAELESGGVEVRALLGPEPTGAIAVLVGNDGRRTFARQPGAGRGLRPEDVDPDWFQDVRLLHVSAYMLYREPVAAAARRSVDLARAGGALISVDLSSAADARDFGGRRLARELANLRPELLFATEREAAELPVAAGAVAKVPVVKLGGRGCRVFDRRVPAPTVQVVDGTGAGDALAAAFCAAYLDGATPLEAAGRAVLVAARAVTRLGARP
ncbi:MAG TPA: PfkB family carbohydrate kinase [Candidatus Dormibacteraeota bacterium]|jgi:sugar/nucleoside kinase (ribokinase family)